MKTLFSLAIALMLCSQAFSQTTRLNIYSAHVFDESFAYKQNGYTYYKGTIDRGFQWGAGVEYFLDKQTSLELIYLHQATGMMTTLDAGTPDPTKNRNYDLGLSYLMLGSNGYFTRPNQKLEVYAGLGVGAAIIDVKSNADNGSYSSSTKFAWLTKLGCNIRVTSLISIKLQGQLTSIIQAVDKGSYLGVIGLSSYSSAWQASIGGGLSLKLGK